MNAAEKLLFWSVLVHNAVVQSVYRQFAVNLIETDAFGRRKSYLVAYYSVSLLVGWPALKTLSCLFSIEIRGLHGFKVSFAGL